MTERSTAGKTDQSAAAGDATAGAAVGGAAAAGASPLASRPEGIPADALPQGRVVGRLEKARTPEELLPGTLDHFEVFRDVDGEDLRAWSDARSVAPEILSRIDELWDTHTYDTSLVKLLADADLLTDGLDIDEHRAISSLGSGLVNMEMHRIDGSVGTMVGVQAGLALRSVVYLGSEEQKKRWVEPLIRGEAFGAFALTEPDHGSDTVALETVARRDGEEWVINGEKRWIGNGVGGHLTVVYARVDDESDPDLHGQVSGFLVEQHLEGYEAQRIVGKTSLRAIDQAHIRFHDVRIPLSARLPEATSFKAVNRVLYATRAGVSWAALGHATACYEAAVEYAGKRIQFGKPLAKHQHVQVRLATMLSTLVAMQLQCRRLAELEDAGRMRPDQSSLVKGFCTRGARQIAADARDLMGGNGILIQNSVARHMADIEAIHTYEGTETMQSLIVGRSITGMSAFA